MKLLLATVLLVILLGVLSFVLTLPELFENKFANSKNVTVTFVGDMMFDRHVRKHNDSKQYKNVISDDLKKLLSQTDLLVGNLEGPISTGVSVSNDRSIEMNQFTFTFSPVVADFLKEVGFDAVSIGNNHILNYGNDGLRQTKQFLTNSDIGYFGDPHDEKSAWTIEENGISLAFVAENHFDGITTAKTAELVRTLKNQHDHVIVFAHWGDEYEPLPSERQKTAARALSHAGASLIIGAHPHVIQTNDTFEGTDIYYSLGNFIFDQYWMESVRCGAILQFQITKEEIIPTGSFSSYLEKDGTTILKKCK